jgi:histidine ammonia-lyase
VCRDRHDALVPRTREGGPAGAGYTRGVIESKALTGDDLALADVWAVAVLGDPVSLADSARERMSAAREIVEQAAHGAQEHTYGVNTGFGRFVSRAIPEELTEELQVRLLRSHACGVGEPYPDEIVRAAMLLRANALAKGYSGARITTVELLVECLNRGVLPRVPSRGSVGASGDLAPLAHLALPLIGEGEAWLDGRHLPGAEALAEVGLEPVRLQAKEGLSLVNGTQFMAAFGSLGLVRARRLAKAADIACALSLEALQGSRTSFLPQVHALRPLDGQAASAANVLRLLEDSAINEAHRWCDKVQDAYSLRCAPQVHGASRDLLDYVGRTVTTELNAATDNPLVLVEDGMLVSNGNFHGQPLAFALDALAMAVAELANIAERRIERLVNPSLSGGLPAFLTGDGGLNSGFMIPQYVAASLVSENKVLAHPAGVDSIPTSAGQEDHVSMGNASGLKAWQVLANAERVLAIEFLAGAQGVEFLAPLQPGLGVRAAREFVRSLSPRLRDDRPLAGDIESAAAAIRDGSLVEAVESEAGELR